MGDEDLRVEFAVVKAVELFGAYAAGLGLAEDRRAYDKAAFERELRSDVKYRKTLSEQK